MVQGLVSNCQRIAFSRHMGISRIRRKICSTFCKNSRLSYLG